MTSNKRLIQSLFIFLPVVFWLFTVYHYSVNVPWFDDFDPFSDFLRKWLADASWTERLTLLFEPNNEHRMVFGKLATLLIYFVTGSLNFSYLHYIGAVFTLGTLFLFWKVFKRHHWPITYFLPVPFLLFQLHYYLIFHWAICSHQHQPVVFFITLSMYLLAHKRFAWSIIAGLCATFAMSNGIFVWVSGSVLLLIRKDYKKLAIWLLVTVLSISFYFRGMESMGNESSIDFFLQYPYLSVLGFFAFLGGLFEVYPSHAPIFQRSITPVLGGFIVSIWAFVWLFSIGLTWLKSLVNVKYPQWTARIAERSEESQVSRDFLLGILIFLLSNALIIGFLRPRFGFFVMIVSNYKLYPALFLIVAYLSFLLSYHKISSKIIYGVIGISGMIWGFSIFNYSSDIIERRKYLLVNAFNQKNHGYGLGHEPNSPAALYIDQLMSILVDKGIYTYPTTYQHLEEKANTATWPLSQNIAATISQDEHEITIRELNTAYSSGYNDLFVAFFRKGTATYLFKLSPNQYQGKVPFKHFEKGYNVVVPKAALPSGEYEVGLYYNMPLLGEGTGLLQKITIER